MNETNILIAFVAVTAIAVVLQMFILLGMYLSTRKVSRRIDALSVRVNEQVLPLIEKVRVIVDESAPGIQEVVTNLTETSALVRQQAGQIDEAITEIVGVARTQAGNAGVLAARTMQRVDRTAEALQHTVSAPMRHLSALVEGVVAGFGELAAGRKVRHSKAEPSDNMFI
jgi:methyl-accepting chemotaxis protein